MLMADERDDDYTETLEDYTKLYELIAEGVVFEGKIGRGVLRWRRS
jgi:hypothetical protein